MFTPVPPRDESKVPQFQNGATPDRMSLFWRFVCAGLVFQALSFIFTFLPWTRYLGETFAGYQKNLGFPGLYEGLPGMVNLGVSPFLLFLFVPIYREHRIATFYFFARLIIGWNIIFSIWLGYTLNHVGFFMKYGLVCTLGTSIAVVVCFIVALRCQEKDL
jgi:hypothetical protein